MTPAEAFLRYETLRPRLPKPLRQPDQVTMAADLGAIAAQLDVFVFDAFGVLNVGDTPIPGAAARVTQLRNEGKRVFVLTNAASYSHAQSCAKFQRLGFDFTPDEIVSSRDVGEAHLSEFPDVRHWGVAAPRSCDLSTLPDGAHILDDSADSFRRAQGFLFLSTDDWTNQRQTLLVQTLKDTPRPVVVANPDIVAPRETGLSLEPGYFAHLLQDHVDIPVRYHGKPFPSVYHEIEARLPNTPRSRIAMVGDTLHTDVLGALSNGWRSVLVSDHGVYADLDLPPLLRQSGLLPDWQVPSI